MKYKILMFMLALFFCSMCGCSNAETASKESVIINLPTDNTVNGYRTEKNTQSSSSSNVVSYEVTENKNNRIQYCANTNSMKFHMPDCSSVKSTREENKLFLSNRDELIELGYEPCKRCNP